MKIVTARITPLPTNVFEPLPEVWVTLDTGTEAFLFRYYPNELTFTPEEFVGLTLTEAHRLKFTKDQEFLRS
jgi:hypothetical protein